MKVSFIFVLCVQVLIGISQPNFYTFFNTGNSPLPDNTIRTLVGAADSSIWVGTDWGVVHLKDSNWTIYQTGNSGLRDDQIRSLGTHPNGAIWVGTFTEGINIKTDTGWHYINTSNSMLSSNHIRALAFENSNSVWIGTTNGIAHLKDATWTIYNTSNSPLTTNNITSIAIGPDSTKWFGTLNSGLLKLKDTIWSVFQLNNSNIGDNSVLDVTIAPNGIIWLAYPSGGAGSFDGSNIWQNYNTVTSNIASNSLTGVVWDTSGWFTSIDAGLIRFNGGTDWQQFSTSINPDVEQKFLPDDHLLSLTKDSIGNLWIGTNQHGLVKFSYQQVNSIQESFTKAIRAYPNPVQYTLNITGLQPGNHSKVLITNLTGKTILTKNITEGFGSIDVNHLKSGLYILQVDGDKTSVPIKIKKE